jgi:HAD superfamily hydrolase (TIGR01490 family)
VISHAPRGDRVRDLARKLDQQGRRLEFLRRYLDLYQEYVEADLRFDDSRTLALFESLDPGDRARFGFDTAVIDWEHYVGEVHCPAITAPIRRLDAARRKRKRTSRTSLPAPKAAAGKRAAAFFDLDGTLLSSNVIETYLWMRLAELSGTARFAELGRIAARVPGLVRAERHERGAFLRSIYRSYAGARLVDLEAIADEVLTHHVLARLAPAAVRRVREHRAAGQPTVLVTGAIRPLTRPLTPLFDHIEAADLAVDDRGVCTGTLAASPLVGEARGAWMRQWALDSDIDLAESFGYADSYSDLPLLDAVGHPVVVRPDVALFRHARRRHWPVVDWASPESVPRTLSPARLTGRALTGGR